MRVNKAVFLDRDGVLNKEIGDYVYLPDQLEIPEGVQDGLKTLRQAGFKLIVITNQGGIDRKIYSRSQMQKIHELIEEKAKIKFDDIFYSPHHKTVTKSLLSKPSPLMLQRAIARYNITPENSFMIGDAGRDLECAHLAGVTPILLPTLKEKEHPLAKKVVTNFSEAVSFILNQ